METWEPRPVRTIKRRSSGGMVWETAPKQPKPANTMKALIMDNGAYTIKVGYSTDGEPHNIPNCIMKAKSERKRMFVGKQIDECRDCSGLYFLLPCEKGYITRWEVQKPVWDQVFSKTVCPLEDYPVVLTQPLFNFKSIQDCIDEIFFEEYEVPMLFRVVPSDLAYLHYARENKLTKASACLVIDTGYSYTHIIPYIKGNKFLRAVQRLNVGGKLLTNHLKDIISYRQYNVMEETYVINQVKEDTCYVCPDVRRELHQAATTNSIVRNYVLPDFNIIRRGFIQDENSKEVDDSYQILRLNNERFVVPEILFHPSDIGMKSMGIAEAAIKSIMSCPKEYRQSLARNIILVGGNCKFPGFKDRIYAELRASLPDTWLVKVTLPDDPINYSWQGGRALLKTHDFKSHLVTKKDYEELGSTIIQERFYNFMLDDSEVSCPRVDQRDEAFRYLPLVKSDIFGKLEEDNEVDQGEPHEEGEEGGSERDDLNKGVDEVGMVEGDKIARKQGRPKLKEEEEIIKPELPSTDLDFVHSKELFPFGTDSYL